MDKEEILKKDDCLQLANGAPISGYVYIRNYSELPDKNGKLYFAGQLECIGTIPFKVWSGDTYNKLKQTSFANSICFITGDINEWSGSKSIIIKDIGFYDGTELSPSDFLIKKYDADEQFDIMYKIITKNCSKEAVEVFDTIIDPIKDRFLEEFGAIYRHDSCINGLIAHSSKCIKLAQVIRFYPNILKGTDIDSLFVGTAIHDIGKTLEYDNGNISEVGKLMSHLTLGINLLLPHRDKIISLKGERFFNDLVSVIQQHHGDKGERPRTLVAYVVSLIDGLEAQLTSINEMLEVSQGDLLKIDDYKLQYHTE